MKVIVKRRISMICAMIMLISSVLGHSMGIFAADETENSEDGCRSSSDAGSGSHP